MSAPNSTTETRPVAFLFDGDSSIECLETLDEAFLLALKAADMDSITSSRVYRGGLLIARLAYRPSAVLATPKRQRKPSGVAFSETQTTEVADMGAYATLVGDFIESCLERWNTVDQGRFWDYVARHAVDATFVPSLPTQLAQKMDEYLRLHPRYIGAVSPDLGNPLHRELFVESMFKDAFIGQGTIALRAEVEGELHGGFDGADQFSKSGAIVMPYEQFEVSAPAVGFPESLSVRGLVTQMRMRRCTAPDVHQKLMEAIIRGRALDNLSERFEWDLKQLPDAPDEVHVQARKLTDYLLNPTHSKGAGKAAFFEDVLQITRDDWQFLQAQLVDRLSAAAYEDVRLDQYGIRFTALLPIVGRNGSTATIETGWIVRAGERASLVTAFPTGKDRNLEQHAATPPIVPRGTAGRQRWETIFDLAHQAGLAAAAERIPTPVAVEGTVVMDGLTGIARVVVNNGRSAFSRWLRTTGRGKKADSGCAIVSDYRDWSVEREEAYAEAFAKVLRRNEIACRVETYLT
jgi:hypothetical protein